MGYPLSNPPKGNAILRRIAMRSSGSTKAGALERNADRSYHWRAAYVGETTSFNASIMSNAAAIAMGPHYRMKFKDACDPQQFYNMEHMYCFVDK